MPGSDPGAEALDPGAERAADAEALDPPAMRAALLAWYDEVGRALPFRGSSDAWAILVSEAMAQQTQAARAGEAWRAFMVAFPTPAALAAASPADVLRAWRGLGYNRRAVNLRRAAAAIVAEHDGRVPDDPVALERLPGVGPYTARAVAALAFGRPMGAVDTNVRRVLGRLAGEHGRLPPAELQRLADRLVDPARPGDWTHALMDLGATRCRPARPDCGACPLARWCGHASRERRAAATVVARAPRRAPPGPRIRERETPFRSTSRWLRGRLVDRLRDEPGHGWVRLDGPLGEHDTPAIRSALEGLARDGLVEMHPTEPDLARLPVASADPPLPAPPVEGRASR